MSKIMYFAKKSNSNIHFLAVQLHVSFKWMFRTLWEVLFYRKVGLFILKYLFLFCFC